MSDIDLGAIYEDPNAETAVPEWRCHHCGTVGVDTATMAAATHVTADRTYLLPHCVTCLPSPAGRHIPARPEWKSFYRTAGGRRAVLARAVETGALRADAVHLTQCPACGDRVVEEEVAGAPVYAAAADQDEAVCVTCTDELSEADITEAYRRRAAGSTPLWSRGVPRERRP